MSNCIKNRSLPEIAGHALNIENEIRGEMETAKEIVFS